MRLFWVIFNHCAFLFFLAWLEASFQEELDPGNVQHEEHARNLVVQLVQQLESKAVESGDFLTKNKLEEIISSIKVSKITKNKAWQQLYRVSKQVLNRVNE